MWSGNDKVISLKFKVIKFTTRIYKKGGTAPLHTPVSARPVILQCRGQNYGHNYGPTLVRDATIICYFNSTKYQLP